MTQDLVCVGESFLSHPSAAHRAACPLCNPTKTVPELNAAADAAFIPCACLDNECCGNDLTPGFRCRKAKGGDAGTSVEPARDPHPSLCQGGSVRQCRDPECEICWPMAAGSGTVATRNGALSSKTNLNELLALVDELEQTVRIASHDLAGAIERSNAREASNDLRVAITRLMQPDETTDYLRLAASLDAPWPLTVVLENLIEIAQIAERVADYPGRNSIIIAVECGKGCLRNLRAALEQREEPTPCPECVAVRKLGLLACQKHLPEKASDLSQMIRDYDAAKRSVATVIARVNESLRDGRKSVMLTVDEWKLLTTHEQARTAGGA